MAWIDANMPAACKATVRAEKRLGVAHLRAEKAAASERRAVDKAAR